MAGTVSCKDCDEDDNSNTTVNSQYTGNIKVKVFDPSMNVMSNTSVFLYKTNDDLKRDIALSIKNTSGSGEVVFENVIQGTYYLRTGAFILGEFYADTVGAQVITGQQVRRDMYLSK